MQVSEKFTSRQPVHIRVGVDRSMHGKGQGQNHFFRISVHDQKNIYFLTDSRNPTVFFIRPEFAINLRTSSSFVSSHVTQLD